MQSVDPVHKEEDGKWWFWDETWADRVGPFDTEEICRTQLEEYCKVLDGENLESMTTIGKRCNSCGNEWAVAEELVLKAGVEDTTPCPKCKHPQPLLFAAPSLFKIGVPVGFQRIAWKDVKEEQKIWLWGSCLGEPVAYGEHTVVDVNERKLCNRLQKEFMHMSEELLVEDSSYDGSIVRCFRCGHVAPYVEFFKEDVMKSGIRQIHCSECGGGVVIKLFEKRDNRMGRGNKFLAMEEVHMQGFVSFENLEKMKSGQADLGIQIAHDGRVWVCMDGVAILRFKPEFRIEKEM